MFVIPEKALYQLMQTAGKFTAHCPGACLGVGSRTHLHMVQKKEMAAMFGRLQIAF